jgi:hypothetical protein
MLQRRPNRTSLAGTLVAITGAARGIGAATAKAFLAAGATVAIGDVDEVELKNTASRLDVTAHRLDVTDSTSFREFLDAVERQSGPLDVLVNNAGIMPVGPLLEEDERTALRIIDINVNGVITGTKLALERMVPRRRGHIVNIASMAGETYCPGLATYNASKYAVVGFTDATRVEFRSSGVELTAILPGLVNTELTSGTKGVRFIGAVEPQDVANAIVGTVLRPRPHVYVPAVGSALIRVGRLLPVRAAEALNRRLGTETVFLDDIDHEARRAYEDRARDRETVEAS